MKYRYIDEPLLQFGKGDHICPKFGIYTFGPFDLQKVRPEKIKLGMVGKPDSIEIILEWLELCSSHIEEKGGKNPLPNLFPNFCGFNSKVGFQCEITTDDTYQRKINNSEFEAVINKEGDLERRIEDIAQLYLDEIRYLTKNKSPDVILCILSEKFITYVKKNSQDLELDAEEVEVKRTNEELEEEEVSEKEQNFRRYLKAKAMKFGVPVQLVRDRISSPTREMQDPATIAWNFFTAVYYKAAGTPWAMLRKDLSQTTCYAGISFFKSRDKKTTQTSIAQIFNEFGKGIILRGEEVPMKKNDPVPHLTEEQAYQLLKMSLEEYYEALKIFPKRLVLHKTSNYNQAELIGFKNATKDSRVDTIDLISIQPSRIRLYREKQYPPLRGTQYTLNDKSHTLYTRGSVPFYETYPGKYIPEPLSIRLFEYDESPDLICSEILALTKMNWNNTQFDRKYPITIECARNVGEILKYLEADEVMQLKYSFYM